MLEVKTWLEGTGLRVAEDRFRKPPPLPYIVFNENRSVRGSDSKNGIADRDITVELYAAEIDPVAEAAVESLLNARGLPHTRDRVWIDSEKFFMTTYAFGMTEKL